MSMPGWCAPFCVIDCRPTGVPWTLRVWPRPSRHLCRGTFPSAEPRRGKPDCNGAAVAAHVPSCRGSHRAISCRLRALGRRSAIGWVAKGLDCDQVQRLLTSCGRDTSNGCRDFAVLTMLVRLGLRAGEVAKLKLDDLDWRTGEILVRGKGSCIEHLPLPADVGEAVAAYLRHGRPRTAQGRTVFVRVRAPHDALTSAGVSQIVAAADCRTGLGRIHAHACAIRRRRRCCAPARRTGGRAGPASSPRPDNGDLCQG
ncbi:tyrosine-type recombinase/integrase [Mesorhizobium sp. WSM3868]|uniref:tyrosine-type recombinase/integrase n=2 Tax=Phyllobacteriaceae TaxID=69277 RepID=UPI0032AFAF90